MLTHKNSHCDYLNYQVKYISLGINFRDVRRANSFAPFYFRGGGMRNRGRARLMRDRVISKRMVICFLPSPFSRTAGSISCVPQDHRDIPGAIERNKIMTKSH